MLRRNNVVIVILGVLLPLLLSGQVQEWVYTYNGTANSYDFGKSIIYGADGYLYVAGRAQNSGTFADIVVIKLDTEGHEQWVYTYDTISWTYEYANQIVYGSDHNLYIAGVSGEGAGSGDNKDFMIISLDTLGNERWVYRYDGPGTGTDYEEANSILYHKFDILAYVYAAGTTAPGATNRDFTVKKLISGGLLMNNYTYDGAGHSDDIAKSIVYGPDGNIYSAGYAVGYDYEDFTIISLDKALSERWVWTKSIHATNLLTDIAYSDSAVFACGVTYNPPYDLPRFAVVSVSFAGAERWIYVNTDPTHSDLAHSLVVSNDNNNVFVTGATGDASNYQHLTVISFNTANGGKNWSYSYAGTNAILETGRDIVLSPSNILYTVGDNMSTGIIVASLDINGNERWVYQYSGSGTLFDYGYSIIQGPGNRIYIAGQANNADMGDLTVICLRDTLLVGIEENQNLATDGHKSKLEVYPNPANGVVHIVYNTGHPANNASLKIYDVSGRLVKNLSLPGTYSSVPTVISWDGTDDFNKPVDAGVYFVKYGEHVAKIVYLK